MPASGFSIMRHRVLYIMSIIAMSPIIPIPCIMFNAYNGYYVFSNIPNKNAFFNKLL